MSVRMMRRGAARLERAAYFAAIRALCRAGALMPMRA